MGTMVSRLIQQEEFVRRVALTAFVLALVPVLASARKDNELWSNLKELQVGQKIEVVDMNFKSRNGIFLGFSEEAISLQVKNKEVAVQRGDVLRVSSREKTRRRRHVLIGAAIGAAAFGALSISCKAVANEGGNGAACVAGVVSTGLVIGAGVAALFPGYTTIYRAKKEKAQK